MKQLNKKPEGWVTELELRGHPLCKKIPDYELDIMMRALNLLFLHKSHKIPLCTTDNDTIVNYAYGEAPQQAWNHYLSHVKEKGPNPKLTRRHAGDQWLLLHEVTDYVNTHHRGYAVGLNNIGSVISAYHKSKIPGVELPLINQLRKGKAILLPLDFIPEYIDDLHMQLKYTSTTSGSGFQNSIRRGSPTGVYRLYDGDLGDDL